ncbi:TolC family protein [Fulvivirga ligni]|uniref:TolC family protein n=1 Tax=Fulvivirga ligni TaxID=2904246 RepID=UPI001F159CD1|nr:TolC family protein [Fulvivirga ligni]UII19564.1 TolC family protein [Fulvivirga ligni]
MIKFYSRTDFYTICKVCVCIVMLLVGEDAMSQERARYTLDSLQSMARNRYPQTRQLLLASRKGDESIKVIESNWLPKTNVVGTASYQSEVSSVSLPESIPASIESPKKDQYKIGLELSQLIFDGGASATSKTIEQLNLKSETNRIEGELLTVKSTVNDLFLGLLINEESFKALANMKKDLIARYDNIEAAVNSGTTLRSTMRELEAEMIGVDQQMVENKAERLTLLSTLSFLVQEELDAFTVFELPEVEQPSFEKEVSLRPEYRQLSTQMELVDYRNELIDRGNRPRLSLFGNGYFGRPGLDFFNNDFRLYGMAGLSLSWNVGGYYTSTHQKKKNLIDKELAQNQIELFEIRTKSQLTEQEIEIRKLQELIVKDSSVEQIRTEVKEVAAVQYENGSITTTDYILKLNAETQAIITSSMHRIQLVMAYINYNTILGK